MRSLSTIFVFFAILLACASDASGGPICNLIHRATHPLETIRSNRAARQASRPQAAPMRVPQPLPKGPAVAPKNSDCPNGNCPVPQKKTKGSVADDSFPCRCKDCKRIDCEAGKGTGPCLCNRK